MKGSAPVVEATLLYARAVNLPAEQLLGELNAAFADQYVALARRADVAEGVIAYGSSDLHVQIEIVDEALPPDTFIPALNAPITRLNPTDFRAAVLGHTIHLRLKVGRGPFPIAGSELLYGDQLEQSESREAFEIRLQVARFLLDKIARNTKPLAIHWALSDKLLTLEELRILRRDPFPLPLFVSPALFSSGREEAGTKLVGFQLVGSEHLIGHRVVFNEAPLPYNHLLRRSHEFLAYCRARGEIVPDGDSFGISASDIIRVRHRSGATTPTVELTYEQVGTEALSEPTTSGHVPLGKRIAAWPAVTYFLCLVAILTAPVAGTVLFLFNMLFGPRVRPTGVVTMIALALWALDANDLLTFATWTDLGDSAAEAQER